jgi:poly-gamma-glutamate synthesis protein (capsule biosynthesis protein)
MKRVKRAMQAAALVPALLEWCAPLNAEALRVPPITGGNAEFFMKALAKERPEAPRQLPVTGIVVPHHLLAADLIARGAWAASGNSYERIIVISPDHFRRSRRPLATTQYAFDTALGPIDVDLAAVKMLIARPDLVDDSDLFLYEHGITAILPFLRFIFPDTPIVPVTLGIGTSQQEWDSAVNLLKEIVTPRTLVVQSTDYSHYLRPQIARARDQETLNVIAANDPAAIPTLQQSNHLDSKAAQYVQLRLQTDVFHSHAAVVANRNAFEYTHENSPSTSYVVAVYATDESALSKLVYSDQQVTYFGGDVFLGRGFTIPLLNKNAYASVIDGVRRLTAGQQLVINLEGVITTDPPVGIPLGRHVMDDGLAGPILQAINVRSAGLANNHSFDLGSDGLSASIKTLKERGIRPLQHMVIADLGAFRLVALNFVGSGDVKGYPVVRRLDENGRTLGMTDISKLCRSPALPPLVAFVHWGKEYTSVAGDDERQIAQALAACGVSLVIGAHSHQASQNLEMIAGGEALMFYSLGNFLFDQISPRGSGALVELRLFKQGTFATRVLPARNFYEAAVNNNEPLR